MSDLPKGISIIVCCYNGIDRIEKTIEFLVAQRVDPAISWEIILVDNASTDGTAELAKAKLAESFSHGRYSIVEEKAAGLSLARKRGIDSAKYSYVIFCDDDNWLSPTYAQQVFDHFEAKPALGIVGGRGEGVFEIPKPGWFGPYVEKSYAIGKQAPVSSAVNGVWGAGMGLRKAGYDQLMRSGFRHLNADRVKDKLSVGGDTEICIALGRMGYTVWYDDDLHFKHLVPADRINKEYATSLYYFIGFASPTLSAYQEAFDPAIPKRARYNWVFNFAKNFLQLIVLICRPATSIYFKEPKDLVKSFIVSSQKGRVARLWLMKGNYYRIIDEIRNAAWNLVKS